MHAPQSYDQAFNTRTGDPANQLNPTGLKNPGFPFWVGGMEGAVGQRAPSPPLDMAPNPGNPGSGGWDGGLPRHFLDGYAVGGISEQHQTRFSFEKHLDKAKARFISEYGNDVERAAMSFHANRYHPSFRILPNGTVQPATYRTNGALPAPGAPSKMSLMVSSEVCFAFFFGSWAGERLPPARCAQDSTRASPPLPR